MSLQTKGASEVLPVLFNLASALATNDTIATTTWTATPSGLTFGTETDTTTTAQVLVSGGTAGRFYEITLVATTEAGQTHERKSALLILAGEVA